MILYLSANGSSYRDPARGNRKYPLDRKSAPLFAEEAYCFYEPFPPGKKTKKTLLKFVVRDCETCSGADCGCGADFLPDRAGDAGRDPVHYRGDHPNRESS